MDQYLLALLISVALIGVLWMILPGEGEKPPVHEAQAAYINATLDVELWSACRFLDDVSKIAPARALLVAYRARIAELEANSPWRLAHEYHLRCYEADLLFSEEYSLAQHQARNDRQKLSPSDPLLT